MKLATALIALVTATPAFAGGAGGLTFDQIKDACQNPAKYQNQLAPANLQVTCEEHVSTWVPDVAKGMQLPRSRYVISSLSSDKYQVSPRTHAMDVDMYSAECPNFKEQVQVTTFSKATSCDELLAFKGEESDFCAQILDKARQDNPKIAQLNDTGRVVTFCSEGMEQGQGKGQGQGQGKGQGK
jgi:hypothetical protein